MIYEIVNIDNDFMFNFGPSPLDDSSHIED